MKFSILLIAFLMLAPLAIADVTDEHYKASFPGFATKIDVASSINYRMVSITLAFPGAAVGGQAQISVDGDGTIAELIPPVTATVGATDSYTFEVPGGRSYWINRTGGAAQPLIHTYNYIDHYQDCASLPCEEAAYANATRLEMNQTRTDQNHVQNTTRSTQNDIQNVTRTEQNDLQNATSLATFCPKVDAICRGQFTGDFFGNYTGILNSTFRVPGGLKHAVQMTANNLSGTTAIDRITGASWTRCSGSSCPPGSTTKPAATGQAVKDNLESFYFDSSTQTRLREAACQAKTTPNNFTVAAFIRPTSGIATILAVDDGIGNDALQFKVNPGTGNVAVSGVTFSEMNFAGADPYNVYTHYAMTWTESPARSVSVYKNGTLLGTQTPSGAHGSFSDICTLGTRSDRLNELEGDMAQFRLYDNVLNVSNLGSIAQGWYLNETISRMVGNFTGGNHTGKYDGTTSTFCLITANCGSGVGNDWFNNTFLENASFENVTLGNFTLLSDLTVVTAWDDYVPLLIFIGGVILFTWLDALFPAFVSFLCFGNAILPVAQWPLSASFMLIGIALMLHIILAKYPEWWSRYTRGSSEKER